MTNDDGYDLGQGAGFYVNATQALWNRHYQMYDHVLTELPHLIQATFPVSNKRSISGNSTAAHGALVLALCNPDGFQSVSTFGSITHPVTCPWGQKAFSEHLGDNTAAWADYDASLLMRKVTKTVPALVDQG